MSSKNTAAFIFTGAKKNSNFLHSPSQMFDFNVSTRSESRVMSMLCVIKFPLWRNREGVKLSTRHTETATNNIYRKTNTTLFWTAKHLLHQSYFNECVCRLCRVSCIILFSISFFFALHLTFFNPIIVIRSWDYVRKFFRLFWAVCVCVCGCVHLLLCLLR